MFRRLATSSIALAALAAPVFAEITPAEVWDHFVAENAAAGLNLTESNREEAGDTLTITDATFSSDAGESSVQVTIPKLVLNQTGDGNVRWTIEGDMTGQASSRMPDEPEAMVVPFTIKMPGTEVVSSGTPQDLTHDYKADSVSMDMTLPYEPGGSEGVPINFVIDAVSGTQRSVIDADGARDITFTSNASAVSASAAGTTPGTEQDPPVKFSGGYDMNQIEASGEFKIPAGKLDLNSDIEGALAAGMRFAMAMKVNETAGNFDFAGASADGTPIDSKGSMKAGPGELTMAMSSDGLSYAGSVESSENEMTMASLPFPVKYATDAMSFDLGLPVEASETPSPFRLMTSAAGLRVNDEIWALFDPQAKLSRDPADFNIDVTGEVILRESLLQPMPADGADGAAGMPAGPQPPEPVKVSINDITLKLMGAEAHLKGELAAPEGGSMTEAPVGNISGEFLNLNAVLATLGEIGLIPQEQMMATRMMMAMFAKPVEGETDKMETELEFRADGSIFANGQQVK